MTTHDDLRELLGAYALDAVDAAERRAVEDHLRGCATCRAEVAEHLETMASLGDAHPPGDAVWERIRAATVERPSVVVPFRPGRRLLSGLVAASIIAVGVLGWRVAVLDGRLDRLSGDTVAAAAAAALAEPEADRIVLRSTDGGVAVDAVLLPDGSGFLVQDNLAALPGDRTYQLWTIVGQEPVSAGVLGADPSVAAFRAGQGTTALAITEERAAGSVRPTSEPIAEASLVVP